MSGHSRPTSATTQPDNPSLSTLWLALFPAANQGKQPGLRERLCDTLRKAITSGQLAYGARLPASRVLASDLRVSRVTVEAAYAQLEAEGYVRRKAGVGTMVSIQILRQPATARQANTRLNAPDSAELLSKRGATMPVKNHFMDSHSLKAFNNGYPDVRAFPIETWRTLCNRHMRQIDHSLLSYSAAKGYAPLCRAIANHLNQSRGVRCDAEQVLILTSSQQALQLLSTMLLDPGDTAWIEEPGFRGARAAFACGGARLQGVPVDDAGINIEAMNGRDTCKPRIIYTTPSHQFPTGAMLTLPRRLALIDFAHQHQCWIIEDDYDSEFQYHGHPVPAMQGLDTHDRVIYVGTFSKVLFPSLRLAYLVLPPALVAPFCQARSIFDGHSAQLAQAVTADFIDGGYFAAHLRQMRQLYRSRRDLLVEQLNQKLGGWLRVSTHHSGLQLAAILQEGDELKLSKQARALGVATPQLSALYLDAPKQNGWILGYASLRNEEIIQAVEQLAKLRP